MTSSTKISYKRNVGILASNYQTKKQLHALMAEKNQTEKKKVKEYEWAIKNCKENASGKTVASVAREGTNLFNFPVVPDTLRRYIRIGATSVLKMGAPSTVPEKAYKAINDALLSYIVIKQMNGEHEQSKSSLQIFFKRAI
jgi:hypothetical protein